MSGQAKFTQDFIVGLKTLERVPEEKGTRLLRAVGSVTGEALIVGNAYGDGTPVDTGNARGHWYTTIGDQAPGAHPNAPSGQEGAGALTQQALDQAQLVTATARLGDVVNFNNDAEYIEELNHGHSSQAPHGMTDVVAMNFERLVTDQARRLGILE